MVDISESEYSRHFAQVSGSVVQMRNEIIIFCMIQGVSRDRSVDIGKSVCSRCFPWCPRLESPWVLKLTLLPSFNNFCLIASLKSHCMRQYPPFPIAIIRTRTEIIIFCMIQGVSRDGSVDIGKSNCSRHFPCCLKLKSSLLLKLTFLQSSDTLS